MKRCSASFRVRHFFPFLMVLFLFIFLGRVGDQTQSVIMSAADEVLAVLKDEEIRPKDKQGMLEVRMLRLYSLC